MLVSDVMDRAFAEFLYPAGVNRPAYDVLAAPGMTNVVLTPVNVEGRVANIPRDTVLEIEDEQVLVKSVAGTVLTLQERGYLETDPVAHAAGVKVSVDPQYTRKAVFNAVQSIVGMLYPWGLFRIRTDVTQTFDTRAVKALPAGGLDILSIIVRSSGALERYEPPLRKGVDYEILRMFSPPKYQLTRGGVTGNAMTVLYTADFTLPATTADDLTATCGVPATVQPYMPLAVAGYLLQGKELPRVHVEEIRRALAQTGVQVGAALNIGQALMQTFVRLYVQAERKRLSDQAPPGFEFVGSPQ